MKRALTWMLTALTAIVLAVVLLVTQHAGAEALRLAAEFTGQPFALDREAPFRVRLYRIGTRRHMLALALHHIAADGWSLGLIIGELVRCYEARLVGQGNPLPPLEIRHGDYALWQRRWLEAGEGERQLAYWRVLAAPHPFARLNTALPALVSGQLRANARNSPLTSAGSAGFRRAHGCGCAISA
eukprot:gene1578-1832_t